MILVFDLDDTLYEERSYVLSGFRAVARWGALRIGQDEQESYEELLLLLESNGRGRIFNAWLRGRASVRDAVKVYRHHSPQISLAPEAVMVLNGFKGLSLYLVTDGHKVVQSKKIEALGVSGFFRKCYLTNRYGRHHSKPSLRCFELIIKREKSDWVDLVYVADNPAKDFVSLNRVGAKTIRVLTGQHAQDDALPGYEAQFRISSLSELPSLLEIINQ